MTVKESPKGWIVSVTTKRLGGVPPSVEIYDAAVPDAVDAMNAVRRVCGGGADTTVSIVAELPSRTDLRDGKVIAR